MELSRLRDAIRNNGKKDFGGYGDMSLTELLPAILTRYSETEMLIAAPSLPDQAADIIYRWMKRQFGRMDGRGKVDVVKHLTIVADLGEALSPKAHAWLSDNPFGDRLTLVDRQQPDTAILLPDFAITGPVNMRYGYHFVATATTIPEDVCALWARYKGMADDPAREPAKEATEEAPREEPLKDDSSERRRRRVRRDAEEADASGDAAADESQTTI